MFVYIGDPKFTGFNSNIYNTILKDAHRDIKNAKELKKDLKLKIKSEKF